MSITQRKKKLLDQSGGKGTVPLFEFPGEKIFVLQQKEVKFVDLLYSFHPRSSL